MQWNELDHTMKFAITLSLILLASPAVAQQQPTAPERIAAQIGNFYIQIQNQQDTIAALQAELAKAQARVKELEAKIEEGKPK
jgi:peptidoglycan hydrolase CwlO-like protein